MGLTNTTESAVGKPTNTAHVKDIMILAVWLGVVTGLVEGGLLSAFQKLRWLQWSIDRSPVSLEIVWISTVFDLLLFVAVGASLVGLGRWFPRFRLLRWSLFFFAWLACFDWLTITGRIRASAVLILAAGSASVAMRWFSRRESSTLRFARRSLPWVVAAALLALVGIEGGLWLTERVATARLPAAPPGSPNILVIVVDTLRADHVSAYGYTRATSPNLDRIAQQGVLFENAFSASSWTVPSHASLLTGRYLHEHEAGAVPNHDYYDGPFPSIAQVLRGDGYRTGAFSANTGNFCRARGFGLGFLHFEDYYSSWADMASRTLYGRKFIQYVLYPLGYKDDPGRKRAPEVNREFFRWVDRTPGKRFFAFLNYYDSHDPYLPPEPYRTRFANLKNADVPLPGGITNQSPSQTLPTHMTHEELQRNRNAYDGAVAYMDAQIERLLSGLEARGLAGKTLIVITSDHGEELGDHGLLGHELSLYRQEIHVPLIFWWPGHIPAGVRLGTPVTNVALPATIMDLLAPGEQSTFPGPSLAQLWERSEILADWPEPLSELAQVPLQPGNLHAAPVNYGAMESLIASRWQYIRNEKLGEELYDWKEDPQELHNLASTLEGQRIDRELLVRLRALVGESFGERAVSKQYQTDGPEPAGSNPAPASSRQR